MLLITVKETNLALFEQHAELLKEGNIIVSPSEYKQEIAEGSHKYFAAYSNDILIGLSAMVKYLVDGKYRIYHRAAYTFPGYRSQGVWNALMSAKVKFINENNWCDDSVYHAVSVAVTDTRYEKLGWKKFKESVQFTETGKVPRVLWYESWSKVKEQFI